MRPPGSASISNGRSRHEPPEVLACRPGVIEGIGDAQDLAVGVSCHPGVGGSFGGEEVAMVAHVGSQVRNEIASVALRDDGSRWRDRRHGIRGDLDADGLAGRRTGGLRNRVGSQDHCEEQRVGGAPGVEGVTADQVTVCGGSEAEAEPFEATRVVPLGSWLAL